MCRHVLKNYLFIYVSDMAKGIIYFIHPAEYAELKINVYKLGLSKKPSLDRCINGYRKGTRYLCIMECEDPIILEKKLKEIFREKFQLVRGYEYFSGNENEMCEEFKKIVDEHKKNYLDCDKHPINEDGNLIINDVKNGDNTTKNIFDQNQIDLRLEKYLNCLNVTEFENNDDATIQTLMNMARANNLKMFCEVLQHDKEGILNDIFQNVLTDVACSFLFYCLFPNDYIYDVDNGVLYRINEYGIYENKCDKKIFIYEKIFINIKK